VNFPPRVVRERAGKTRVSHRMRHGVKTVDHDVALGLIDAHGHIKPPIVESLVENFRVAMQPADACAIGGVD